jgi:hypothetical protein
MTDIPLAEVRDSKVAQLVSWSSSRMWWVAALCFVLAVGLGIAQLQHSGVPITLQFRNGYGLKPGDAVRLRGIQVGEVDRVELAADMQGVTVHARLHEDASRLARVGARYWIERPAIRLGKVEGVETLLSGQYVAVAPGPSEGDRQRDFEGLDEAPAMLDASAEGLEIILQASDRLGLERGSPIRYRGVTIGAVMSVGLSKDATRVESRVYIEPEYRSVVRQDSRFWSISGVEIQFGLGGFELAADSLATITAGGAAMATPTTPGPPAETGDRFVLVDSPEDEWLAWQPAVPVGSALWAPNQSVPQPIRLVWRESSSRLSLLHRQRRSGWALPLASQRLLAPRDLLVAATEDSRIELAGATIDLEPSRLQEAAAVGFYDVAELGLTLETTWPDEKLRKATAPEDVVLVGGDPQMITPVPVDRLSQEETMWRIDSTVPLGPEWHGSVAVAVQDGCVIGVVLATKEGVSVQTLP